MWTDEIVEETRKAREEYAAKFNYDLEAIYRDLMKQQEQSPEEFVSLPSKPPRLQGKYRGRGLMKELLAEKKREREM